MDKLQITWKISTQKKVHISDLLTIDNVDCGAECRE
jgi:hypothetical protein